jgi:hypothetical protein
MPLSLLFSMIQILCTLASGLIAVRLCRSRLFRRYPALFAYMVFRVADGIFPLVVKASSIAYFWIWCAFCPVVWVLNMLVVRELCRIVLERHQGLFTLGRWVMYGAVATSGVLSILSMLPRISSTLPARSRLIWYALAADRGIHLGLVTFLLLMLFAVSRYPVRLSRNILLNAFVFTAYYLANSLTSLIQAVFDMRVSRTVDAAMLMIDAVCMVAWFFCLTPAGELAHVEWMHFGADYETRVLNRLDSLNRVLQRAA